MKKLKSVPGPAPSRVRLGLAVLVLCTGLAMLFLGQTQAQDNSRTAVVLTIDGPIGPATRDYLVRGIEQAETDGAELVVLRMDTPGGLDASMRDIIRKILNADVPVASWVAPVGARAASAGTYILYASHIAAMAPSTNLGAATPVQVGGGGGGGNGEEERPASPAERIRDAVSDEENDEDEAAENGEPDNGQAADADDDEAPEPARSRSAEEAKVVEDAVAYIRGLAERHGRNADWAERAVRESVSLTASQALEENVTDLIAETIEELLEQSHGREIRIASGPVVLDTEGLEIQEVEPDWRSEFLSIITNPTLAYLLFIIGIYGLILEGYNPGALVPGVVGGICLILALYAFQVLPVNYAGLALIVLGFALILAELFIPSFGILGIGGVAAVIFGSIILMDTGVPGFGLSVGFVAAMGASAALLFAGVMYLVIKSVKKPRVSGTETLVGETGEALNDFSDGKGRVHVAGEDWSARSDQAIARQERVRVTAVDGLFLEVKPISNTGG